MKQTFNKTENTDNSFFFLFFLSRLSNNKKHSQHHQTLSTVQKLLGDTESTEVVANVGWEQEFFAVDKEMYLARPDLVSSGRMLVGAQPRK